MLNEDRVKYYTELPSQPFETGKSVFMYEVRQMAEELLSLREQLAAINGAQEPVGFVKCDPCAEDCRWDCVDPIYLAGSVTLEGYGSDYFEVYRHPAPLKE
ncbi:hypothetical protein OZ830_004365 [Yersinia enterocolitica]|uniref:hypothetical protein n=1 Tax=Yersinia vastinensis TaxID=2890318 RepID=UPI0011A0C1B4|nr:hypothetical protein [Yersinia vastinensis]